MGNKHRDVSTARMTISLPELGCEISLMRQSDICTRNWPSMEHEFAGWRMFAGGTGGEQVCKFCEMGEITLYPRWGKEGPARELPP